MAKKNEQKQQKNENVYLQSASQKVFYAIISRHCTARRILPNLICFFFVSFKEIAIYNECQTNEFVILTNMANDVTDGLIFKIPK